MNATVPGWTRVRSLVDGAAVTVDLPPGWWALRPDADDVAAEIDRVVSAAVEGLADGIPDADPVAAIAEELTADLHRMVRVAAAGGAALLAAGAGVDDDSGQLVTASLLVAPYDRYGDRDRPDWTEGPVRRMALPTGAAVRRARLGTGTGPFGEMRVLELEYVVAPSAPPSWVLGFRTPALRHVAELSVVFDAIAAYFRVIRAGDSEPAFA
jgi:hypothetical protein